MNEHLLQMASHVTLQTPCVTCHFPHFKVKKLKPRRAGNMSKIRQLTNDRGKVILILIPSWAGKMV